jgi:ribonuclease BN (tRNA processing enzyme)
MDSFTFIPLGIGDAFSSRFYSSCYALGYDGQWLLVDCPHPIRKILREAGVTAGVSLDVGDIAGIVLTHLHADHCCGIEGFALYKYFVLGGKTALWAHPQVSELLWDRLAPTFEHLEPDASAAPRAETLRKYFELHPLDAGQAVPIGPFAVECRFTRHGLPTTALRIRAGDAVLGISADTEYDPDLIAWLTEADLFLHETGSGPHTPYEKLLALPAEVRAKLHLTHLSDQFDLAGSDLQILTQGRRYRVG